MKQTIVKDRKALSKPCRPCDDLITGEMIGKKLLEVLEKTKDGAGLAANQIGIDSRVAVVSVPRRKPIVLVNPEIIGKFKKITFQEGCLSFPGDYILTERYANILVKADNHSKALNFSAEENILECVCVQHEIDHLDGITMFDRQIKEK